MKISVFYEHIEKACEQTKKPLEEVLAHVKKSGIDGTICCHLTMMNSQF